MALPANSLLHYFIFLLIPQALMIMSLPTNKSPFREYIGTNPGIDVNFDEIPINDNVEFHFILSFAVDYTLGGSPPTPTNGDFNFFWASNITPEAVKKIKRNHRNVKVVLGIGGDRVRGVPVKFEPTDVDSWVDKAVVSLKDIIQEYELDGIDINYNHFNATPDTFAKSIGKLISNLTQERTISLVSIAPTFDEQVQNYYLALWGEAGPRLIDYVGFQFYTNPRETTVIQFLEYFNTQATYYEGGNVLASFITDGSGGLSVENGFFQAVKILLRQGKLHGILAWSADLSKAQNTFAPEKEAQDILANF